MTQRVTAAKLKYEQAIDTVIVISVDCKSDSPGPYHRFPCVLSWRWHADFEAWFRRRWGNRVYPLSPFGHEPTESYQKPSALLAVSSSLRIYPCSSGPT